MLHDINQEPARIRKLRREWLRCWFALRDAERRECTQDIHRAGKALVQATNARLAVSA